MFSRKLHTGEDTQPLPIVPSSPSDDFQQEVLRLVREASDADSFLGELAGMLRREGYEGDALKLLRYPSIFCPCDYHHRTGGAGGVFPSEGHVISSKASW